MPAPDPPQLTPAGGGGQRLPTPPQRPPWFLLVVMLAASLGTWAWQARSKAQPPSIGYSRFFGLVEAGKVKSLVMTGQAVEGQLSAPEKIDGKGRTSFEP